MDPPPNSHSGDVSTGISVNFDQSIDPTTATPETVTVHSTQSEWAAGAAPVVTTMGDAVRVSTTSNFHPGELIHVTTTSGIRSVADVPAEPRVWQFRTGVHSGSSQFSVGSQDLGNLIDGNVSLGDLDGDGDLDVLESVQIAFLQGPSQGSRIWLNQAGEFTDSGQRLGNQDSRATLGDIDGDGDLDAYVANGNAYDYAGQDDRIWLNNGEGRFNDSGQSLGNEGSGEAALGDLDGDGDLDAFVPKLRGNVVWLNQGGQFVDSGQSLGDARGQGVELGDLDGDGDLDAFVITNAGNRVWLNDGGGLFIDSGQSLGDQGSQAVELGDLDGDGDLDALVANSGLYNNPNRVWFNNGGLFTDSGQALGNRRTSDVAVGDLDGDGDLDAWVSNNDYEGNGVWLNDSNGIFVDSGQGLGNESASGVSLGDLDRDGDLDAWVSGTLTRPNRLWLNQNLVPSVMLLVDNSAISEASGTSTITATLSAAHGQPVTVDLGFSGTATATDDYTTSGAQIVIAAGATTGSVTVTAVQDAVDEPNETVIVNVTGVTNGQEAGSQQVTVTILDDDEPPMPNVTLSVDATQIAEAAGEATFTATLSEITTVPVTVDFAISGTAAITDYTASATQVVVAPGATTGSMIVTAVQDEINEPDEMVTVAIVSVAGGNEESVQEQTVTIVDDDLPPSFAVSSLEPTASGFQVEFTNELDASELNLYDTQNAGLGPADVVVTGASSGVVAGSLVIGTSATTFIKSGGPLAADTYTVTLRSATDGFKDTASMLLDGNGNGISGDDYSGSFTIDEDDAARTVSIPDFVRGPGQDVNLPANETTGIPLTISDGDNVRAADIRIGYDPELLEITGATAPAGGSVIVNTTTTPGVAILVFFSSASLPAGSSTFINLHATVPEGASYGGQQVLDLHAVTIGDGNDNEFPVVVDDAFHCATYFADVSGNGRINASDAAQVARIAALLDAGFAATPLTDPAVVGDISGNGRVNAADASLVARSAALIEVPQIPPIPAGVATSSVVHLGPGLPDLGFAARQVAQATSQNTGVQWSDAPLLPPAAPDPYQAVDAVMASMVMLDEDERLIPALEDAMAELLSVGLPTD